MLTEWVNLLRGYLKERGLDNVFRIFYLVSNTEVYLLKEWGSTNPDLVASWYNILLTVIGGPPV